MRIVDVAEIDDDRLPQRLLDAIEIERAELVPLRRQDERVGTLGRLVRVVEVNDVAQDRAFEFSIACGS